MQEDNISKQKPSKKITQMFFLHGRSTIFILQGQRDQSGDWYHKQFRRFKFLMVGNFSAKNLQIACQVTLCISLDNGVLSGASGAVKKPGGSLLSFRQGMCES